MKQRVYWLDTLETESRVPNPEPRVPSPEPRVPSPEPRVPSPRVDVLVVGAGYTGLSAARRLAKSGASVLVVDREGVGFGASSRNGGQVLTGLRHEPAALLAAFGASRARELFDASRDAMVHLEQLLREESIACDYARCGHIQAAWKPSHFDAFRDEQALLAKAFEHDVALVSTRDQRMEIGSDRYFGLLVDEHSAGLNPARYVHGLAAVACRAGARVVPGVAVERIERQAAAWNVTTSAGAVLAREVVIATNGYTDSAAPALRRRLIPIGSYSIVTEPLPETVVAGLLPKSRMAFDSKHFLYYFRLAGDRRLLFGGRAEFTQPGPVATLRAARILREGMTTIFPQLAEAAIEYAWGGNVAFTRDELPHAGRLDGLWFAAGYCGHGIALATHLGDLVAQRLAGGEGRRVDHPLFDLPLPSIPLYRGTPWFLPLVGAYYRVKDWLS